MAAKNVITECHPIKDYKAVQLLITHPPIRERLIFSIGFFTGLRLNEIVSLKWSDFMHIEHGRAVVRDETKIVISKQTKLSGRLIHRAFPVIKELKETILEYFRFLNQPALDAYIFTERRRRMAGLEEAHISRTTLNRMVKQYLSKYQIQVSGNDSSTIMRKTWAYFYHRKNGLERTQKAMGHTTSEKTLRYIGITREAVMSGYENFYTDQNLRSIPEMVEAGDLNLKKIVRKIKEEQPRDNWRDALRDELKLYTNDTEDIEAVCRVAFLL